MRATRGQGRWGAHPPPHDRGTCDVGVHRPATVHTPSMYVPLNIRGACGRERCLHAALEPCFCAEGPRERREPPFWLPEFDQLTRQCTGDPDFRGPHAQTREPFSRTNKRRSARGADTVHQHPPHHTPPPHHRGSHTDTRTTPLGTALKLSPSAETTK